MLHQLKSKNTNNDKKFHLNQLGSSLPAGSFRPRLCQPLHVISSLKYVNELGVRLNIFSTDEKEDIGTNRRQPSPTS